MTRTEVIAIARDVGMCGMLTDVVCTIDELERFAALVVEAEREARESARATGTDSSGAAQVDYSYAWRPIDDNTPRGTKLQLISRRDGVATYGHLGTDAGFWTHWAPLPTFRTEATPCDS